MDNSKCNGVEHTLFIPLMARIEISKRFPEFFCDKKALKVGEALNLDATTVPASEYLLISAVCRTMQIDRIVQQFISSHSMVNIVNIGCGFCTMAWRSKQQARFYEVDFPSVIEQRRTLLGTCDDEVLVPGNANDIEWIRVMDCTLPTLFVVAGVFQFFTKQQVIQLFQQIQSAFSNAEILFDACDEVGLKYAKKYIEQSNHLTAQVTFFIDSPDEFAAQTHTQLLSVTGLFDHARAMLKNRLKLSTRIAMKIADTKKRIQLIHLKL